MSIVLTSKPSYLNPIRELGTFPTCWEEGDFWGDKKDFFGKHLYMYLEIHHIKNKKRTLNVL